MTYRNELSQLLAELRGVLGSADRVHEALEVADGGSDLEQPGHDGLCRILPPVRRIPPCGERPPRLQILEAHPLPHGSELRDRDRVKHRTLTLEIRDRSRQSKTMVILV